MTRLSALKLVNPILGVLVFSQVLTGLVGAMLPRELFGVLHKGGGIACGSVAVLHVVLNWNWIKANYFRR